MGANEIQWPKQVIMFWKVAAEIIKDLGETKLRGWFEVSEALNTVIVFMRRCQITNVL